MPTVMGFRCRDGIVLCADQQVSTTGALKSHERTITVEVEERQSIVLAYSGLPSLAREFRNEIRKKIGHAEIPSDLLYLAASEVLTDMGRRHASMDLQLLIGKAAVFDTPILFEFDGSALRTADDFSFLGTDNSSLLRFQAETMYSPRMNVEEATNLAIYLIHNARQYYINMDVHGGPINTAIMRSGDESCQILLEEDVLKRLRTGISKLTL